MEFPAAFVQAAMLEVPDFSRSFRNTRFTFPWLVYSSADIWDRQHYAEFWFVLLLVSRVLPPFVLVNVLRIDLLVRITAANQRKAFLNDFYVRVIGLRFLNPLIQWNPAIFFVYLKSCILFYLILYSSACRLRPTKTAPSLLTAPFKTRTKNQE